MSLIQPKVKPGNRNITINISFDLWNELLSTGQPKETLESILNGWLTERLKSRDSYFQTNRRVVKHVTLGELSTQERLVVLEEQYNRAKALGKHRQAEKIRTQITEVERDLLLMEKQQNG